MTWKPIDTYVQKEPGERVLVFVPNCGTWTDDGVKYYEPRVGEAVFGGFEPNRWAWANDSCACCYSSMREEPTVWQPLPTFP